MIKTIEKVLTRSREHCEFKKAWIPKGWTCVNIKKCAEDIAKELGGKNELER